MAPDPQYYIREGVRRAVAARELGFAVVPAWLIIDGQPDRRIYVSPDQLHSPRDTVIASHPRYLSVLKGYSTPAGRLIVPPLAIEPLGVESQTGSFPLNAVRLVD